jgi:pimeloyl-ACP methyl ester carboxylesterase
METQYLERAGGKIAYSDYGGNGETVLMLPGMGALRSEYRFLAPQLSQAGFRPVTMDLRGQGESSVPWDRYDVPSVGEDIFALLEHLGSGPAHVIGTSFAPAAIVWAAAQKPERFRSLVLISPFVRDVGVNPFMKAIFWLMLNNPWRVRTWGMYYNSFYPTRKPADFSEYLAQLLENLRQPGRFQATAEIGSSSRQPSSQALTQLHTPVLVVMGSKDPDFPDPAAEGKLVAEQTGGNLALITGAGHYPQTEMPEQTTPVILEFLGRHRGTTSQSSAAAQERSSLLGVGL